MAEQFPVPIISIDQRQAEIEAAKRDQAQQKADFEAFIQNVYKQGAIDAQSQMQAAQQQRGQPVPQQPVRYTADHKTFPSFYLQEEMNRSRGRVYRSPLGVTNELFGGSTPVPGMNRKSKSAVEELFGDQFYGGQR